MSPTTGSGRSRLAALFAAALLALSGGALTACGDDKEGPAEDVGKAIDKGSKKAGEELHESAKEAERDLDDGKKD
jgi:hypothetical protein